METGSTCRDSGQAGPTPMCQIETGRGISDAEVHPEEPRVPAPYQALQPGFQCWEGKSPQFMAVKTSRDDG